MAMIQWRRTHTHRVGMEAVCLSVWCNPQVENCGPSRRILICPGHFFSPHHLFWVHLCEEDFFPAAVCLLGQDSGQLALADCKFNFLFLFSFFAQQPSSPTLKQRNENFQANVTKRGKVSKVIN